MMLLFLRAALEATLAGRSMHEMLWRPVETCW